MASLREAVKDYQDELQAGIAWVAFWREGRSWHSDYIYLEIDDTLTPEDRGRLREIQAKDPAAVILNGYYCGYLGEDMNLAELTAGVRRHYESSMNDIADFIEAHDDTLPPELIEEARAAAHAAGLPFSEKPYRDDEDFNPYVFDGSMSIEDFELMHRMMNEERSKRMSETFSILIDSRSRFETGQPGGEWLSMPTTTEQLHAAMRSVGITAENPQDFFINGFSNTEQFPFDVPLSVVQGSTIDELNYLGKLLEIQNKSILSSETRYFFICPTQKDIDNILAELSPAENKFKQTYSMMFDVADTKGTDFNAVLQNQVVSNYAGAKYENAESERQSDNYTYGGFLFIGLLLSLLFMVFLTLVIYYKQITEGYSDRYNFEVMQKVGLDRNEISAIVHKEIRTMFFFPLFMAVIHLAVSLYAVAMLLSTLGLTNILVLLLCAISISLLFVFIYIAMYFSTARTYYRIVTS